MLKDSLPFFFENAILLNPRINLGSKIFNYLGVYPNGKPTTFLPSNINLSENVFKPIYKPLWLCFSSNKSVIIPSPSNVELNGLNVEDSLFQLKVYYRLTFFTKNKVLESLLFRKNSPF